ncbi:GntR family transcriptional regulator [Novosphingobium sp. G106]|uniref:GntR family transcriptional regulator n=1 Tax=Novosphingobium sp. G106 TaxID=2849500 RepID=UPI001C2D6DF3|nr:GntR family transcriptional regulator [Novosphingobium sp. G106]MBV1686397.1 GntR family transcriptional regulator [Novosphingobium sp. G106]
MAADPVTSERIYALLKADLMSGVYSPGEVLVERRIASDFGISISPVRACAYRLVGERMLELNVGGGFRVPEVTEAGLRDLYFWHGQLVRNSVNAGDQFAMERGLQSAVHSSFADTAAMARGLFERIAIRSANAEILAAIRSAGERLHVARLRESSVMPGIDDELAAVQTLTEEGSGHDLLRAMWAYHRRRLRRIPELVAAVHRPLDRNLSS